MTEIDRRNWLQSAACGFGSLALAGMCHSASANSAMSGSESASSTASSASTSTALVPHLTPRAKRVIFVFMQGGPSQVDTFDYKPELIKHDGKKHTFRDARKMAKTGAKANDELLMKSPWEFRQYGESGRWASDLFPNVASHADDLCFLHGLHTNGVAHGPSTLFLHTGSTNLIRPSVGSWITYGLGSECDNLPGFVTICPSSGNGGPRNYSNAFLPAKYQGTAVGSAGQSSKNARIENVDSPYGPIEQRRRQFDLMQTLNAEQSRRLGGGSEIDAVIGSFELGWRMQQHAPEITNITGETESTLKMYGIGEKETDEFGRQCLLARRMAEAGVRYIQVTYGDNSNNPRWDQHSKIQQHAVHAKAVDLPIAGLLADLKARGLLEDTLVWWGGEFGRNPFTQGSDGRDHNPKGFTHFLAGGGVRAGFSFGETDEFGHEAVNGKVHMHDLHATLLYMLGLDHQRLTYRYAGRDFRLTDLEGHVVHEILA
ncbi:MAG: DUF1501 domain-containing protein [Planctomycetaceae bacterium]